jgi:flagellar hook-length control protein FliK
VKISPPDLGKVDIQILKNGQAVTINISTETENAKNIISKTLQSLVGNLRDEGYQPISIKVNVTQEEHYLADQNQQHQQEQEQKKYNEEDHNGDQSEEGTYYTFDEYLRSDLNA